MASVESITLSPADQWHRDGYLVLRQVVDPTTLGALKEACDHALQQWRQTSTRENQPMGLCHGPDAWIMLHLNHAAYYRDRWELLGRILNAIAIPQAIEVITQIMHEPPVFMQANYYLDPPERPTAMGGSWHRDCEFFSKGDKAVERATVMAEASPPRELHMHIPLVSTAATGVVPGSHVRWDTPQEAFARLNPHGDMPGGIRLPMEPGDIGFFHVNSIHRGYYEVGVPRRTIAVSFGSRSRRRPFDVDWWKMTNGYVATYQPWCRVPHYLCGADPSTVRLFQRFIDCYGDQWTPQNLHPQSIGPARVEYYTKF